MNIKRFSECWMYHAISLMFIIKKPPFNFKERFFIFFYVL